jgi:biopolymer transport protein ExbB/TolQ
MGKNIFHGLLIATPVLFIILYFSLSGKEEVKSEARVRAATQAVHTQSFDNDFNDARNGRPKQNSPEMKARQEQIATLKDEQKRAVDKRDGLDAQFDDLKDGMNQALKDEDQRLAGKQKAKPVKDTDPRLTAKPVSSSVAAAGELK